MLLVFCLMASISVLVAACGGGGSSSSSSSEPAESAESSETAEGSETADAAEESGGSEGGESSAEVEKIIAEATAPAKWEGPTEPDPAAPNKKILLITVIGGSEGQKLVEEGAEAAAKAIGWEVNIFNGDGTPASYAEGIAQAITEKADGVVLSSITPTLVINQMKELKAAGIPAVALSNTVEPVDETWIANVGYNEEKEAKYLAAGIAKESGGEAKLLMLDDKEFGVNVERYDAFTKVLPELCADCKIVHEDEFQVTELETKLEPKVAGLLQAYPETNYIYAPYDDSAIPMIAAVKQAGLQDEVSIASYGGYQQSTDAIREGDVQNLTIANAVPWQSWEALDVLNRYYTNKKIPQNALNSDPVKLLTKETVPPEGQYFTGAEAEYEKHYEELWK